MTPSSEGSLGSEPEIEVRRFEDLSPRQVATLTLEGREIS
jgi:hypothetical protein